MQCNVLEPGEAGRAEMPQFNDQDQASKTPVIPAASGERTGERILKEVDLVLLPAFSNKHVWRGHFKDRSLHGGFGRSRHFG